MAGKIYEFKTAGGAELIPVADDDFFTDDMDAVEYSRGECFLQFYDTDGVTPVTPATGTIVFRSAGIGVDGDEQYLRDGSNTTIDATTVIAGDATYSPPSFNSIVRKSKMTLASITGASFVRAFHVRYE